jgi:hypothetical protein
MESPEQKEVISASDLVLYRNAQAQLMVANNIMQFVYSHLGQTYKLNANDQFDDETGEIQRIVVMPLHQDEPNGNGTPGY